jgi:hypothetical protein
MIRLDRVSIDSCGCYQAGRYLPWDLKQATRVLFPLLAPRLLGTNMLTDNGLVSSHDDVVVLQFLRRHTTRCTIVDSVTQSAWHTVILGLLFPVGKDGKRDD